MKEVFLAYSNHISWYFLHLVFLIVPVLVNFCIKNELVCHTLGLHKTKCIIDGWLIASINSVKFKFCLIDFKYIYLISNIESKLNIPYFEGNIPILG